MPAVSRKQQRAAYAALAIKRGKKKGKKGGAAAKMAKSMTKKQLKHFTRRKK